MEYFQTVPRAEIVSNEQWRGEGNVFKDGALGLMAAGMDETPRGAYAVARLLEHAAKCYAAAAGQTASRSKTEEYEELAHRCDVMCREAYAKWLDLMGNDIKLYKVPLPGTGENPYDVLSLHEEHPSPIE